MAWLFVESLGPLFTGVVIAGRIGAGISAEIGTMKVTEQIDALESMSQDPINFIVVPRFLASIIMLPLLPLHGNPMVFLPHRYCCFLQFIV